MSDESLKTYLLDELVSRKLKNPAYSLRSLARQLNISHTSLSQIISGKRPITAKMIHRISDSLGLPMDIRNRILGHLVKQCPDADQMTVDSESYQLLAVDEFKLISEWYHFAILSLADLRDNVASPKWISTRLGISEKVADEAFQRLEKLSLIECEGTGFRKTGKTVTTTNDIPSSAIKQFHLQILTKAQDALIHEDLNKRDISSHCLAFDPEDMEEARLMIEKFRRRFVHTFRRKSAKKAYVIAMQFFSLENVFKSNH